MTLRSVSYIVILSLAIRFLEVVTPLKDGKELHDSEG